MRAAGPLQRLVPGYALALLVSSSCGKAERAGSDPGMVPAGAATAGTAGTTGSPSGGSSASGGAAASAGRAHGGSTSGGASCEALPPPVVELLVDTSGSLDEPFDDDRTKWEVTSTALLTALSSVSAEVSIGLSFYPNIQVSAGSREDTRFCIVPYEAVEIAPLSAEQRDRLASAIEEAATLGATPTHPAYRHALSVLDARAEAHNRSVVLITDGTPTYALDCRGNGLDPVDMTPIAEEAAQALARGIRTFVIALGGDRSALSRVAHAGGTARIPCSNDGPSYCHGAAETAADLPPLLAEVFESIQSYGRCAPPDG